MSAAVTGARPAVEARSAADPRSRSAVGAAGGALVMGLLAERLLWRMPWGIGAGLWMAALVGVAALVAWRGGASLRGQGRWMAVPALVFAFALAWRGSATLMALNFLATVAAVILAAWRSREGRLMTARVGEYVAGTLITIAHTIAGALLLTGEVRWRSAGGDRRGAGAAVRGLMIAAPLLVVFYALLANADPVFERAVEGLFAWSPQDLLVRAVWVVLWGWITAGLLRQVLLGARLPGGAQLTPPRLPFSLGGIEAAIVLGLLDGLFLLFVVVQIRYLFGGAELVQAAVGMSYAEYARRGFFELVAVTALALPVLLGVDTFVSREDSRRSALRWLSAVMIALLLIVIASALERMRLYRDAYGLTEERFYAIAVILWLGVSLLWFAATVLRGRGVRFAFGTVTSAFAVVAIVNVMNPGAFIARTNLEHARATGRVDREYLAELGPDAAPVLLRQPEGPFSDEACAYAASLAGHLERWRGGSWTSWNAGRARAASELRERLPALRAEGCDLRAADPRPSSP